MTLETIEQECLKYLQQARNPLVAAGVLYRRLTADEEYPGISEAEFLDFLSHHELFKVVPSSDGAEPRIILTARVPTKDDLAARIQEELTKMIDALGKALDAAERDSDTDTRDRVQAVLDRAHELQQRARDEF